ncbi:cysteine hydrolase family protein [Rubrimonas cliftonensis]|uniref:Nicotinamidase-related amidase n=1 Tax=Rubrimonas cliftonensis TaxID=89524 RepID=A0A1H4AHD7_9RHOB|nr:isochorismatase family cysteine hydrolase [Rubrimonas cliftonensis]SEA35171.1 Nicotinamidase-related amidase [Rubrimonas cliftonensis]
MPQQPLIVGRPALLVIDIQKSAFLTDYDGGIPKMTDYVANMRRARTLIDAARAAGVPLVFFQEAHRPDMVDFGRELDGTETVHCVEGREGTEIAAEEVGLRPDDYVIRKRRYSCFFGTDLEILLKGLKAQTLVLVGGLTDVCVHYTFADGHQHDYHMRVAGDAVGGSSPEAHAASLKAFDYLQTGAVRPAAEIAAAFAGLAAAAA